MACSKNNYCISAFLSKYEFEVIRLCCDPLHESILERCIWHLHIHGSSHEKIIIANHNLWENLFAIIIIMKIVSIAKNISNQFILYTHNFFIFNKYIRYKDKNDNYQYQNSWQMCVFMTQNLPSLKPGNICFHLIASFL